MDVAVIVPTHNRGAFLPSALDSIIRQSADCRVEIAVIDDGSTDNTAEVMQTYAKRFADPAGRRVIRYQQQEKQGVVVARNLGLAQTHAPLVAFLDSDDLWGRNKLARQIESMRDPGITVSHTGFRYIDDTGNFTDEGPQRVNNPCVGDCAAVLLKEDLVIFSSVLARRSAINAAAAAEEHGQPFAPGLTNAQDYDLLLRLARIGRFVYLPEPLTHYRRHDAHAAMGNLKRAFGFHCKVQRDFAKRWGPSLGIDDAQADVCIGEFLFGRVESAFWRRDFKVVRDLCELAKEQGVADARFDSLSRRAAKPEWVYRVKDRVGRFFGRGSQA